VNGVSMLVHKLHELLQGQKHSLHSLTVRALPFGCAWSRDMLTNSLPFCSLVTQF
jgi:hypothetical protein